MTLKSVDSIVPSKILICGLGSIGCRHLRILRNNWPNLKISVLRSGHGPECEELNLADNQFYCLEDALNWAPSAAVISSPAPFHLDQALPLARDGVPLLIEKPVVTGTESSYYIEELLSLSSKTPILIGYVLRHDPCAAFVKQALQAHSLGRLIEADFYCGSWLPDWRIASGIDYRNSVSAKRELGGGVLLELSHELDLALWLLGEIRLDNALLRQSGLLQINAEDQAILFGISSSGTSVTIRLNFCTQPAKRAVVLRSQEGELVWDLLAGKVKISKVAKPMQEFEAAIDSDERFRMQAEHFFACIAGDKLPICSLEEGLEVLGLVRQAHLLSC